jgi:hypothetical protein
VLFRALFGSLGTQGVRSRLRIEIPCGLPSAIISIRPEVPVRFQCDRRRTLTERPLDGNHVAIGRNQSRGVEVPQVVQPVTDASRIPSFPP